MANNSAAGIRWDLSDLFAAHDDGKIESTLNNCRTSAEKFAGRYRATLENPATLSAATLHAALEELAKIFEALSAGASGYILKKTDPARMLEAIRELYEGGAPMSSQIARKVVAAFQQQAQTVGDASPAEELDHEHGACTVLRRGR